MREPTGFSNKSIVFLRIKYYILSMDIQSASVNLSQAKVQEQAAIKVQAMGMDAMREQMAALEKLLASVQPIIDLNLGQRVDIVA